MGRFAKVLLLIVGIVGCGNGTTTVTPANVAGDMSGAVADMAAVAAAATFTQVYTTVIANRCMPCHTTANGIGVTQGHLDMTTQAAAYANLVNAPTAGVACAGVGTRVVPRMPGSSIMFLKVSLDDPAPCGSKMPLGGPPLARSETDLISSWITAGALNN
jgi:hypothetical protein